MKFTGERFVPLPELLTDEIGIEHLHRYHSVVDLIKNKIVLDIACGEGYGSLIMSSFAKSVTGVDIDPDCIKHASDKYTAKSKNLSFHTGTVINIPFPNKSFDVVVSFETIEHISEPHQKIFLSEAKRVLKDNGVLIISTPDKSNYNSHGKPINEFHEHELERPEFKEILEANFNHVWLFDQGFEIVSLIKGDENVSKENAAKLISINDTTAFRGKYIIGVCSDVPVRNSITSLSTESTKSYQGTIDRIIELQQQVEDRSAWGLDLDRQRVQNESVIAILKEQISQTNCEGLSSISIRLEEIQASVNELNFFKQKYNESEMIITELKKSLQEVEEKNQILIKQKEDKIETLVRTIEANNLREHALKDEIENLKKLGEQYLQHLKQKEDENIELEAQKAIMITKSNDQLMIVDELKQKIHLLYIELGGLKGRLAEIYESEGWAALKKYYHLKGWLLHEDSWRYKTLRKFVNKIRNKKIIDNISPASPVKSPLSIQAENEVPQNSYTQLEFHTYTSPDVSIIIPVYNGWILTYRCLQSILANTFGATYEVVIGDDCSTDETRHISEWVKNIKVVRHDSNKGFLQNCNAAAKSASGKYILFLNNDTEVKPGWLSSLISLLEKNSSIGMAGSKLIYPDGRLQEAGGIIWQDASGWNYGHKQDPEAPEFNYIKEVDYISGASIIIRSTLWKEIGGFDERFSPAYCEDSDLAFMVRQKGYKVVYQPLSEVIHHEGSSHGSEKSKAYQQINNEKFREKWQAVLNAGHFPNAENVFWARERSKGKKTILVIDHYVPQFDKDAGSRTVFQFLKIFVDLGMNVKFIGDNFYKHEPYTTVLQQMGIEVLHGSYYAQNWQNWLLNNKDYIDYILLNRPHISIKYIDFLKSNMPAKLLYYGHDLHFRREQKKYDLEKSPSVLEAIKKWEKIEKYLFEKSDIILAPSDEEKTIIDGMLENEKAILIRPYTYEIINPPIDNFSNRKNILFVGGFNHGPNVDGVLWFVDEVWPLVRQAIPDANFFVVGSHPPEEVEKLNGINNIVVKGFVSDNELDSLYASVRLVVIPLRYGAGVKGKTVETIYKGIPFISTSFGVEGLPGDSSFLQPLVADQAIEFGKKVCELYKDENQLKKHSSLLIHYIKEYFTFDQGKKIFASIFTHNN